MKNIPRLLLSCLPFINPCVGQSVKKIYIQKFVDHPALNETAQGIIDGLAQQGYTPGEHLDLRVESAQANPVLASQIAEKFVSQGADIVVGIATLSAQSMAKSAQAGKTKLVFSSVTDPVQAGIVEHITRPNNHTSGVSNFIQLEPQLQLFQRIQPKLKRLGFLYNPSESNSLSLIKKLEDIAPKFGMTLVLQAAHKTADIPQAATKLASNVDAIFISNDSTALSALPAIIQAANKVKVPVYVSDTDAVQLGALAALGPNQYKIGLQTAHMIVQILKGQDPGVLPVQFPQDTELFLNIAAADALGITLSEDLKNSADKIIQKVL